jgi:hypothetical protein
VVFFSWAETPPERWVRELAAISPPSERLAHAELWWEAGFPWCPVQRWVIYQLTPLSTMPVLLQWDWAELMEMEQPCRCSFVWVEGALCSNCLEAWPCRCGAHTSADSIRCGGCKRVRSQGRTNLLNAFRRGYRAQEFWILQGETGGHKLRYTPDEKTIAQSLGMAGDPPSPGSLPYVGWDYRVRDNLLRYDMAQRRFAALNRARADERDTVARDARAATEAYLTGAFDRMRDETPRNWADNLPRTNRKPVDDSVVSARYIETGRLGPS